MRDTDAHYFSLVEENDRGCQYNVVCIVLCVHSEQLCLFSDLKPELMGNLVTKDCKTVKSKNAM